MIINNGFLFSGVAYHCDSKTGIIYGLRVPSVEAVNAVSKISADFFLGEKNELKPLGQVMIDINKRPNNGLLGIDYVLEVTDKIEVAAENGNFKDLLTHLNSGFANYLLDKETALQKAVQNGHTKCVQLLTARSFKSVVALDLAAEKGDGACLDSFLRSCLYSDIALGRALVVAATHGKPESIKLLLAKKQIGEEFIREAFIIAAKKGSSELNEYSECAQILFAHCSFDTN